MIVGLAVDLHPSQFYQEMKLVSVGAFEVKLREHGGKIINTIRGRSMKGQNSDTRWRQILFDCESLTPIARIATHKFLLVRILTCSMFYFCNVTLLERFSRCRVGSLSVAVLVQLPFPRLLSD